MQVPLLLEQSFHFFLDVLIQLVRNRELFALLFLVFLPLVLVLSLWSKYEFLVQNHLIDPLHHIVLVQLHRCLLQLQN